MQSVQTNAAKCVLLPPFVMTSVVSRNMYQTTTVLMVCMFPHVHAGTAEDTNNLLLVKTLL